MLPITAPSMVSATALKSISTMLLSRLSEVHPTRYTSRPSLRHLERVYGFVGQYVSFFQPVMKLRHKSRNGARVHKVYDTGQTPYRRLQEYDVLTSEQRTAMQRQYALLTPVSLKRRIDRAVEDLLKTAERHA